MSVSNIIDIIIIVPILYGLIHGLIKGLAQELAGIIGLVAAIIVAKIFAPQLSVYLSSLATWQTAICEAVSYLLLFFLTAFVVTLIGRLFTKLMHAVSLGWVNRLLGGVFGAAKWLILVSAILNGLLLLNNNFQFLKPEVVSESRLISPIAKVAMVAWDEVKELELLRKDNTPQQ